MFSMLGPSFRIASIAGIEIRLSLLFVIWAGFRILQAGPGIGFELYWIGLLFGIVLAHELGHCFGARAVGGDAPAIILWPLGGLALTRAPMRPWPRFVTVAAGPAVNVVFAAAAAASLLLLLEQPYWKYISINPLVGARMLAYGYDSPLVQFVAMFYSINLVLLAFNLLPIYPLDGGSLLQIFLWPYMGLRNSMVIASVTGMIGGGLLAMWGLSSGSIMLVLIAVFGVMTCWQRYQEAVRGLLIEDPQYLKYDPRPRRRWPGWFRWRSGPSATNPNPGGWERKISEEEELRAEVDRILKKAKEKGMHSLTYVERQKLERMSAMLREREVNR